MVCMSVCVWCVCVCEQRCVCMQMCTFAYTFMYDLLTAGPIYFLHAVVKLMWFREHVDKDKTFYSHEEMLELIERYM